MKPKAKVAGSRNRYRCFNCGYNIFINNKDIEKMLNDGFVNKTCPYCKSIHNIKK